MLRIRRYFRPYVPHLLLLVACVFGQVYATLSLPDYTAKIINQGIVGLDRGSIYHNGLIMLLYSLLGGAFLVGMGFFASRIATGITMRMRGDYFRRVEQFSLQEFNQYSTASLITRCTNDMQQIQTVLALLLRLALMAPIMGVWAVAKAYRLAPSMTWIMAAAISAVVLMIGLLFTVAIPRFKTVQKLIDQLNLVSRETLTGLRVIRAFNKQAVERAQFAEVNANLTAVNVFVNRMMAILQPGMQLILSLTSVAIVWVGASRIDNGSLQTGNMLAFQQYAMQSVFAFLMISFVFILVPRAAVSANRVFDVLDTPVTITDPTVPVAIPPGSTPSVVFDHVSFAYPGAETPVLEDISFTARAGETTAIIGSTGSGKSTLVNLIPRFYDATAGQVLVDGVDVRDLLLNDLYARIGYVPQKSMLFSGTVASNLRYGAPESSDDEIRDSARIAQASSFVEALEGAYDHQIAQGGGNVSGGQKQRLSIARAIALHPEILIFDDSFSALDFSTESRLRAALRQVSRNRVLILVAQRVTSLMHAEQIVVIDEGRLVGKGTHAELLASCAVYREIAESQLSEQELGREILAAGLPR